MREEVVELRPLKDMLQRVLDDAQDSDVARYNALMYAGEMALKLTVVAALAGLEEDSRGELYRVSYHLVHASSLGVWAVQLNGLLSGTESVHVSDEAMEDWHSLTQVFGPGSWQYKCCSDMNSCARRAIGNDVEPLPRKVSLRNWMDDFVRLRNKVRAHGAPVLGTVSLVCDALSASIVSYVENLSLFRRPWVYLHRNFSGRYRVVSLGGDCDVFSFLKTASSTNVGEDGIYVWYGRPKRVPLTVPGDLDPSEVYLPNGGYSSRGTYETLSYVSGARGTVEGYREPPGELPPSETQGLGVLGVTGRVFTNVPWVEDRYVDRPVLEQDILMRLIDENHPVITLFGRGGIGKTSTALHVLKKVSSMERFDVILWFSARDLDLLPDGPKRVAADNITQGELARTYVKLVMSKATQPKDSEAVSVMASALTKSPVGPTLFVFDNFETLADPQSVYAWIDTYIRLPNKVLITTRNSAFKADFPVEVNGMSQRETLQLIAQTGLSLGIESLLTERYVERIVGVVDGHPYIVKMVLGAIAREGKPVPPEKLVTGSLDVLAALFERTYGTLSPAAKRVFLLVVNSRVALPEVAVEAAILGYANEPIDVKQAIEELHRSSFVERTAPNQWQQSFMTVPTVSASFGRNKLAVSPYKPTVELETEFIRQFGPTQASEYSEGWGRSVRRMMKNLVAMTQGDTRALEKHMVLIEGVAHEYGRTWLLLAQVYEESSVASDMEKAKEYVRRYLESSSLVPEERDVGWKRLQELCYRSNDYLGELQSWVEWAQVPGISVQTLSEAAGRVHYMVYKHQVDLGQEDTLYMVRQLAQVALARARELDAVGCSRVAWLLHDAGDNASASTVVRLGMDLDSTDGRLIRLTHCPWCLPS
jgi:hypothetical protein